MKSKKVLVSYRFEKSLLQQIREIATEKGWTNTNVVIRALKEYFEQHGKNSMNPEINDKQLSFEGFPLP